MGACCCGPRKSEQDAATIVSSKKEEKSNDNVSSDTTKSKDKSKKENKSSHSKSCKSPIDPNTEQEVTIRIIQARNLPRMDATSKTDAYVVVSANGQKYQTSMIKNSHEPIWNDAIVIKGKALFSTLNQLNFDLYDKNVVGSDTHVGGWKICFGCELKSCVTPAVWYKVSDSSGRPVGAEVQLQLQFRSDTSVIWARNYTHVLELTVVSGRNLRDMSWLSRSRREPYVSVEIGRQSFRTSTRVARPSDQKQQKSQQQHQVWTWNESLYLFVDDGQHKNWQLVISVLDKDLHSHDHVGTAYLPLGVIYDAKDIYDKPFEGDVPLQPRVINLDRGLRSLHYRGKDKKGADIGKIHIRARLVPRREVEMKFFERLVQKFDSSGDGKLQRSEVTQMLAFLDLEGTKGTKFEKFMQRANDKDGVLTKDELMKMLTDAKFQQSESAAKLIQYHLQHSSKDFDPFSNKLMQGMLKPALKEPTGRESLQVKSRQTGMIVTEHIPGYVEFAFNLMYKNKAGRVVTSSFVTQSILRRVSEQWGRDFDSPESVKNIDSFIKLHNLDTSILDQDISSFRNFNDFFARGIRFREVRPMSSNEEEIASPADCRMMVFNNIYESTKFWIKGDKFSIESVLGRQRRRAAKTYEGGAFCIARLAPQDYHKFHWPVSGTVEKITHVDGSLYAVNPIVVNRNVNVFSENKRCVVELKSRAHGRMVMVVVAAAFFGSYRLFEEVKDGVEKELKEGSQVKKGEVAGEFRYGGSTVLLLFERGCVEWKEDLLKETNAQMETLIQVRDTIGGVAGKV